MSGSGFIEWCVSTEWSVEINPSTSLASYSSSESRNQGLLAIHMLMSRTQSSINKTIKNR